MARQWCGPTASPSWASSFLRWDPQTILKISATEWRWKFSFAIHSSIVTCSITSYWVHGVASLSQASVFLWKQRGLIPASAPCCRTLSCRAERSPCCLLNTSCTWCTLPQEDIFSFQAVKSQHRVKYLHIHPTQSLPYIMLLGFPGDEALF